MGFATGSLDAQYSLNDVIKTIFSASKNTGPMELSLLKTEFLDTVFLALDDRRLLEKDSLSILDAEGREQNIVSAGIQNVSKIISSLVNQKDVNFTEKLQEKIHSSHLTADFKQQLLESILTKLTRDSKTREEPFLDQKGRRATANLQESSSTDHEGEESNIDIDPILLADMRRRFREKNQPPNESVRRAAAASIPGSTSREREIDNGDSR